MEDIDKKKHIFSLFILIFLAFSIRFFFLQHASFITPDGTQYVTIAKNLINKGEYKSDGSHFPDIIQPPLYPLILSVFIRLFDDLELLGRLVSAIFGSLLIIPFFHLSQRIFNKKVAYIGSTLIVFYPALIQSSIDALTESTYIFFVYSSILIGWIALERCSWKYFFLTGIIFGLSYLTRIEGISYLLAFFFFSAIFSIFRNRSLNGLFATTFVLSGFIICIIPYQFYVEKKLGTPFLIPKLRLINIHKAISRDLRMAGSFKDLPMRVYFGLTEDSSELLPNHLFFKDSNIMKKVATGTDKRQYTSRRSPYTFYKVILFNLKKTYKDIYLSGMILSPGLIIFLVIGFFNDFWVYPHWSKNLYLFILFLTGRVFMLSHVEERFIFPSIPIIIIWIAIGVLKADDWLLKTIDSYHSLRLNDIGRRFIIALFLTISVLPFTYNVFQYNSKQDDPLKIIGHWMRENINHSSTILASNPQSAFYGRMRYLTLPYAGYREVLKYAWINCADYLLLYKDLDMESRPLLEPLMMDGNTDPALRLLKKMETPKGGGIYLYEIITKGDCIEKTVKRNFISSS